MFFLNFHQFSKISPKRITSLQKFATKVKRQNNVEGLGGRGKGVNPTI
jgi:hypothetical protein